MANRPELQSTGARGAWLQGNEKRRSGEAPHFQGFWVYGDGPAFRFYSGVQVEAEILFNTPVEGDAYHQLSYYTRVESNAASTCARQDFEADYRSRGKVPSWVRRALEGWIHACILELYDHMSALQGPPGLEPQQMFTEIQLRKLAREMRGAARLEFA